MALLLSLLRNRAAVVVLISLLVSSTHALIYNDRCTGCIPIDVYFHATAFNNGTIMVGNQTATSSSLVPLIQGEMNIINDYFSNTPFVFTWVQEEEEEPTTNAIIKDDNITTDLCRQRDAQAIVLALKDTDNATYPSLNVFLGHQTDLANPSQQGCGDYPFLARYPSIYVEYVELNNTVGIPVFVHEIGHWLGVFHTDMANFNVDQDDPCSVENVNDFVADTSPQSDHVVSTQLEIGEVTVSKSNASTDFITTWDSCPNVPGNDSIWNIMNKFCKYASCPPDARFEYTEGQIQRMYYFWLTWHQQGEKCGPDEFLFGITLPASFMDQVVVYNASDGQEIFNAYELFTHSTQPQRSIRMDLCLSRRQSYVVVVSRGGQWNEVGPEDPTQPEFRKDGAILEDFRTDRYLNDFLNSFVLLEEPPPITLESEGGSYSFQTQPQEQDNNPLLTPRPKQSLRLQETPASGCPRGDALLEIEQFESWYAVAVFEPHSEPILLSSARHCLRYAWPPQPVTVVVASLGSTAPRLRVKLDSLTLLERSWPYYEIPGTFKLFSTLVVPDGVVAAATVSRGGADWTTEKEASSFSEEESSISSGATTTGSMGLAAAVMSGILLLLWK